MGSPFPQMEILCSIYTHFPNTEPNIFTLQLTVANGLLFYKEALLYVTVAIKIIALSDRLNKYGSIIILNKIISVEHKNKNTKNTPLVLKSRS